MPKLRPLSEDTEIRLALLEQSITQIDRTLKRIEMYFERLDGRLIKSDSEANANYKWLVGIFVTIGLALAGWIHVH